MARERQSGKAPAKRSVGRKVISAATVAKTANDAKAVKNNGATLQGKKKPNGVAAARPKRSVNNGAPTADKHQQKTSQAELLLSVSNKLAAYQTLDEQLQTLIDKTERLRVHEILDYHTEKTFPNVLGAFSYFKGGIDLYRTAEKIGTGRKRLMRSRRKRQMASIPLRRIA